MLFIHDIILNIPNIFVSVTVHLVFRSKSFQVCRVVNNMSTVLWDVILCSFMDSFICFGGMVLMRRQHILLECQYVYTVLLCVKFQEIMILFERFARLHHNKISGHTKSCPFSFHLLVELFVVSLNCLYSKVFWACTVFRYHFSSI